VKLSAINLLIFLSAMSIVLPDELFQNELYELRNRRSEGIKGNGVIRRFTNLTEPFNTMEL
jgi:hypothetical protein